MKDEFDRTINYMRISLTDRCNLRCSYCMPVGACLVEHKDILTYEELLCITKVAVSLGIHKFKITGGEPLVRKGALSFIQQLKAQEGVSEVTLTTNGTLLKQWSKPLIEAKIDGINVSLDTLDSQEFQSLTNSNGQVSQIVEEIIFLAKQNIPVKINTVILPNTLGQLEGLLSLAKENKVDLRFIELMPIGEAEKKSAIKADEILNKIKKKHPSLTRYTKKSGNGPAVYYQIDGFKGAIGFIRALSHSFCENCNRIRLTSVGELKPCLCYEDSVDLRAILRGNNQEDIQLQLRTAMTEAIAAKPRKHNFNEEYHFEKKAMYQIGG